MKTQEDQARIERLQAVRSQEARHTKLTVEQYHQS